MNEHIAAITPPPVVLHLRTISGPFGLFQIRAMEGDTHGLFFARAPDDFGGDDIQIASHPNSFSCEVLAVRTIDAWEKGTMQWAIDQANFIINCGGTVIEQDKFYALLAGNADQLFENAAVPTLK
jgi:hypothetical protein